MAKGDLIIRNVDIPDLGETFADSLGMTWFDGGMLRLEFCVTRMDEPKPPAAPTGRRYPACRLVLDHKGMVDLINRMQQISGALEQSGMLSRAPSAPQNIN